MPESFAYATAALLFPNVERRLKLLGAALWSVLRPAGLLQPLVELVVLGGYLAKAAPGLAPDMASRIVCTYPIPEVINGNEGIYNTRMFPHSISPPRGAFQ